VVSVPTLEKLEPSGLFSTRQEEKFTSCSSSAFTSCALASVMVSVVDALEVEFHGREIDSSATLLAGNPAAAVEAATERGVSFP
jgi:hypothetical protein